METHKWSFVDFVNAIGFGYVQDLDHVAGFQAHQFHEMPAIPNPKEESPSWEVQRVELVSLLKFAEPGVYISEYLPRMDDLRDAPMRPLRAFERTALVGLQQGSDLRIEYGKNCIRMLGSIRALTQCVKCHDAERGQLLGAFSYVIGPEPNRLAKP